MLQTCLLFAFCKLSPGVYRLYGRAIGDLQKGLMPICASQDCCCQCPCPCSRPLLTHASTKDPQTLTVKSISVSCGVTYSLHWILMCTRFCLCPLFPPVLWEFCNQIPLSFKSDSQSFCWIPQVGKTDVGHRTFTKVQEPLWYYCSPDSESPTHLILL